MRPGKISDVVDQFEHVLEQGHKYVIPPLCYYEVAWYLTWKKASAQLLILDRLYKNSAAKISMGEEEFILAAKIKNSAAERVNTAEFVGSALVVVFGFNTHLISERPKAHTRERAEGIKPSTRIKDTGNAMTNKEMLDFSEQVNKQELIHYRNEVGCQTRKTIRSLTLNDLKRKPKEENLARLLSEGGLLDVKKSLWLKDFWGRHTVSGLILLPLTYHHMLHFPDSIAIKQFIKNGKTAQ